MGIHDRDYYRSEDQSPGIHLGGPRSMVTSLILLNVAIFLFDILIAAPDHWLSNAMQMRVGSLGKPWLWWQMLTSGFAHDPESMLHIGFNMVVLWFFGRDIEERLGRAEFLRLYLVLVVFSSLCWALFAKFVLAYHPLAGCLGASGAVSGMFLLFAIHYPQRQVLLFFLIPVRAWVAGLIVIAADMFRLFDRSSEIGHSAHLAGIALAFLYWRYHWDFGRLLPVRFSFSLAALKRRPKLRIHDPDEKDRKLDSNADRILEKLHREGEGSLTAKERRVLEAYSRRMQEKYP